MLLFKTSLDMNFKPNKHEKRDREREKKEEEKRERERVHEEKK